VGGKTQIIKKILGEFPTSMENYQEIFLGWMDGESKFYHIFLISSIVIIIFVNLTIF
jgi:hypothetical protein